jgi:formamidopyrimidine-DNA glycosylase
MPELPEVETVRRQLAKELVGRKIKSVEVNYGGRLNVPVEFFVSTVGGRAVKAVERRAKLLIIRLTGGWTLLSHLKMTGRYRLLARGEAAEKHDHLVFRLAGPHDLAFNDFRKFGFVRLYPDADADAAVAKEGYGPEPLERAFTPGVFAACLRRRPKGKVKQVLMDQQCVAGIGNIYADESLWGARLAPTRSVASLKDADLARLHDSVVTALKASVKRRGTSAESFFDLYGRKGTNVKYLEAYGRAGEPCARCGTPLKKVRLAGRGTVFCPKCQK